MTTDLQSRIAAIKAECEEILKLSEKATAGPWRVYENMDNTPYCGDYRAIDAGRGYFSGGTGFGLNGFLSSQDARFIAHSRNVSPAMARVVIDCIRWFTNMEDESALEDIANRWEGK